MTSKILNKKIIVLKNEIQVILTKISTEEILDNRDNLINEKENKLKELMEMNAQLIDEENIKKEVEYKKIVKMSDAMEFARVKNKSNRNELLTNFKENREKAKDDFEKYKKTEDDFKKIDSVLYPGFLFFKKEIVDNYGVCPYVTPICMDEDNIKAWLDNKSDNGKLYYDLYEKIIERKEYNFNMNKKNDLEIYFLEMHKRVFTENQEMLYSDSLKYLEEYINCAIKTKKMKEKFKLIINNQSIIVLETGLRVNEFISLKNNINIPVNNQIDENIESITYKFISESYNSKLEEYKTVKDDIINSKKYIDNTMKNLKQELNESLFNYINKPKTCVQESSNLTKKWSLLTTDEKSNRYESFIKYFVSKFLLQPKLLDISKKDETILLLTNLFQNFAFKQKDIKWNIKMGIIEKIHILKWDDVKKECFIENKIINVKENILIGQKKPSSVKTIFNKDNEKIINEEIVKYILSKLDDEHSIKEHLIKEIKENFIEILKLKLRLKRITINDKSKINKQFDEIYNIILQN